MKKSRFAVLALAAMVLAGCATNKGYVGTWECDNPAPELSDGTVKSITVYIMEQGGFSLTAGDANGAIIHGINGEWAVNETGGLELSVEGESEKPTGQLLSDDSLLITGDGDTVRFVRRK